MGVRAFNPGAMKAEAGGPLRLTEFQDSEGYRETLLNNDNKE